MARFTDLAELERELGIEENDEPFAQRQADGTVVGVFPKSGVQFVYDADDANGEAVIVLDN